MKNLLLALAATAGFVAVSPAAHAQHFGRGGHDSRDREVIVDNAPKRNLNDGYDRAFNQRRRKTVYVIERNRPVRREVFVDERGRYFQLVENRPVLIRERVFETYPERYFYRDGRRREGITINFGG